MCKGTADPTRAASLLGVVTAHARLVADIVRREEVVLLGADVLQELNEALHNRLHCLSDTLQVLP